MPRSIIVQCIVFAFLFMSIPTMLVFFPSLGWADSTLLVYCWLLFHPLYPYPWVWRVGWLLAAGVLSPALPFGAYLIAGIAMTVYLRAVQRTYVGHTHPLSCIVVFLTGILIWEGSVQAVAGGATLVSNAPSFILPASTLALVIGREALIVIAATASVVLIRSKVSRQTVRDTLRQYYEHLQELHFRSTGY